MMAVYFLSHPVHAMTRDNATRLMFDIRPRTARIPKFGSNMQAA